MNKRIGTYTQYNALDEMSQGRVLAICAGYAVQHADSMLFSLLYNRLTGEERYIVDQFINELSAEKNNQNKGGNSITVLERRQLERGRHRSSERGNKKSGNRTG